MIFNIGNGPVRKLPVLDPSYPQDVTANVNDTITFETVITEEGKPAEYTYQWYYDDSPVEGATEAAYTTEAEFGDHTVYCMVTNKAGVVTSRTATVSADTMYLYYFGDKKASVTGGWMAEARPMYRSSSGSGVAAKSPTVTTQSNGGVKLTVSYSSGVYRTTNKIDLTNIKTITLNGQIYGNNNGNANWGGMYVWSAMGNLYVDNVKASVTSKQTTVKNPSLNVSSLTGAYYIGFGLYDTGSASNVILNSLSLKQ